jgi:DNA processing protein
MEKKIQFTLSKYEIWFIQTIFTNLEKKQFKFYLKNNKLKHKCMKNIIKEIIKDSSRQQNLTSEYEYYINKKDIYSKSILLKNEIEYLIGKNLDENFPLALQYTSEKNILRKPLVAIIGSRQPTFYGREQTYRFSKELASKGCTILSGGAIGIDYIANSVALEQGGYSCAILGNGIKNPYPPSNKQLFNHLEHSQNGLILSEFKEDEPAQKWNFPKRNHTISMLADFVLIIEATLTSGSLITANAALEYGTDVGAIPGSIDSSNSSGTNSLIQKGAFCINKPSDVLERVHHIYSQRVSSKHVKYYQIY